MSHFPAGQPTSLYSAGTTQSQTAAIGTGNLLLASYSTVLDFGTTSTDPYLLFTTDANRGRFFPIHISIVPVFGSVNGPSAGTPPAANIGWFAGSNPYDNFVGNFGLQPIYDPTPQDFGPGYFDVLTLQTWQHFKSAPASTGIYINLAPSSIANDKRVVTVTGLYTG